jgi:hypothetical protein
LGVYLKQGDINKDFIPDLAFIPPLPDFFLKPFFIPENKNPAVFCSQANFSWR